MREILIILDLNGSIADKQWNTDFTQVQWTCAKNIDILWDFIRRNKIQTMLWSAAYRNTIDAFVEQCVPKDIQFKDIFCWDNCLEDHEFPKMSNGKNIARIKNLEDVWRMYPEFNESNTVIFDDTFTKVRFYPDNAIILCGETLEENVNQIMDTLGCLM
jgi:hypothetical protein